jgi:hypothetical protein
MNKRVPSSMAWRARTGGCVAKIERYRKGGGLAFLVASLPTVGSGKSNYAALHGRQSPPSLAQAVEKFAFDGVKRSFPLAHVPYKVNELRLSDRSGHSLPILCGMYGMSSIHARYDAMLDPTVPEIAFHRAYGPGIEATLTYEYNATPGAGPLQTLASLQARAVAQGEPLPPLMTIPGWQESDSMNYRDFENAMHADEPIEYALCQWLMLHEDGIDGFTDEQWEDWYQYARAHCPRFDKEQPKYRRRDETMYS